MKCAALFAAVALTCTYVADAATVHVRGADGHWIEIEAQTDGDIVSFTITPEQAAGGRALVVINKPDWMVLDDAEPPRVIGYTLGDETIELSPGAAIELGAVGDGTRISLDIADNANPIDVNSLALRVTGGAEATFQVTEEDREGHSAVVELDLSRLGPGAYDGTITVADLAPSGNTAELPVRFSIFGMKVTPDGQTIRLAAGGAGFSINGDPRQTVTVEAAGVSAYPTLQIGAPYLYVRDFAQVRELASVSGWHMMEADCALEDIDGNPMTNEEAGAQVRLVIAAHPELPVTVVRTEVTNLADARDVYCFWGWLPGANYVTPDGETHEWSMQYRDFGHPGWVYIAPRDPSRSGVGWITPAVFGESRFGTMIVYTDPKKITVEHGESVSTVFAIMPATGPEAVRTAAEALARSALEEFAAVLGE